MIKDNFLVITVHGEIITLEEYKGTKLVYKHDLDILESESSKTLFTTIMKHDEDIPLIITYKDLCFLRKIGIRV